jgi:alpha-ketoglutarate-dependent taurine dioxygenase
MSGLVLEVENVSLSSLEHLVRDHRVVVIRNAGFDPASLQRLTRSLNRRMVGGRQNYELRIALSHERDHWHSDLAFVDRPPVIGAAGLIEPAHQLAHTKWIDTAHAYETLPHATRELINDLRALHTGADDDGRLIFQTTHPVVRVQPATGRRSLFLGRSVRRLIGFGKSDSDDLLSFLHAHLLEACPQTTIPWSRGDVLVWDNTSTVHDTLDGLGAMGCVEAFAFAGQVPIGADGSSGRARHGSPHLLAVAAS